MPQTLSPVDVANLALATVNKRPILSFADQIESARMVSRWYDHMRRELLEECDWTFARKVVKLNLIGEATGVADFPDWAASGSPLPAGVTADNFVFPWAYIYQYPPNVRFVHKVYNVHSPSGLTEWSGYAGTQFRTWLEAQKGGWELVRSRITNEYAIACNIQDAICKYTYDMTDSSQFSSKFVTALSLKIAQKICIPLTGDPQLKQQVDADLRMALDDAMRLNLSENPEKGPSSSVYEDTRGM